MISIIVPTFNRVSPLTQALESFVAQDFPIDQFEIVIVDNGSTDATRVASEQFITRHPDRQIRYFYEPEPGLLSGRHRGALESHGDILVFVDDDIEAELTWLQAFRTSFADPSVQLVGGRNVPRYDAEPPGWLEWFWHDHPHGRVYWQLSLLDFGERVRDIDANDVWGLDFAIRKQALIALRGFHPDLVPKHLQHFQGDGETGLTRKANEAGYRAVYNPQALIFHHVPKRNMTYEYFEERHFYQGVCDSYTHVRSNDRELRRANVGERIERLKEQAKSLFRPARRWLLKDSQWPAREALRQRFEQAYVRGYEFHQHAIRRDPTLLEWIRRKDYWDYRLPILPSCPLT